MQLELNALQDKDNYLVIDIDKEEVILRIKKSDYTLDDAVKMWDIPELVKITK